MTQNTATRSLHITQIHAGHKVITGRTVVAQVEPRQELPGFAADAWFTDGSVLRHRDGTNVVVAR